MCCLGSELFEIDWGGLLFLLNPPGQLTVSNPNKPWRLAASRGVCHL